MVEGKVGVVEQCLIIDDDAFLNCLIKMCDNSSCTKTMHKYTTTDDCIKCSSFSF